MLCDNYLILSWVVILDCVNQNALSVSIRHKHISKNNKVLLIKITNNIN